MPRRSECASRVAVLARMFGCLLAFGIGDARLASINAQEYPTRTIKIIVPYAAGGTSELLLRPLAKKMSETLGQPIVIENIAGAAGTIGVAAAARAEPDGYTLLFGYASQFTLAPAVYRKLSYDPISSFAPIRGVVRFHFVITAHASMPFKTLPEMVAYAKSHPGQLTFGSPGVGTSTQLIGELIKFRQGIDLVHVPYRGGGPAINDYIAGRISVYWDAPAPLAPWIEKGSIRPLAVTAERRLRDFPDVPTVLEVGMPELNVFTWTALFAPAGTRPEIVAKIEAALNSALADAAIQKLFEENGYEMFTIPPVAILDLIRKDYAKWRELTDATGIKLDQ